MVAQERPKYTGIRTHRDSGGRFQFRYPAGWHEYELTDGRDGVMYSPESESPETWFAAWSTRLEHGVVATDLDILREGVDEGVAQLPDVHVESSSEDVFGNLIRFERVYTFDQDGAIRKRKVWMVYVHKWLFALIGQGASVEAFDRWSMMLQDCFGSFDLAPTLWFASDQDLTSGLA